MTATLPWRLFRLKPDAFHATFIPPTLAPDNMAYTLPCTAVFQCPEYYPGLIRLRLQALCGLGVRKSRVVMCISEHVRDWLMEHFKMPAERLAVVRLGANSSFRPWTESDRIPALKQTFGIDYPYFLFSGRWEARKNIFRIIEAFARFKRERKSDFKLVFTGQRTWAADRADALIERLGVKEDVADLGKTPFRDLPLLYGGATALVYPSLWESFGLVLAEAMRCGTPIITSNVSAMPETAGKAALLVDPYSIDDIAAAMDRLSVDAELRRQLGAAGIERSQLFTWEQTAKNSLAAYQQISALN